MFFSLAIYYICYLIFPFIILMAFFAGRSKNMRTRIFAGVLLIISLVCAYMRFVEPKLLIVNNVEIKQSVDQVINSELKIVVFADIHLGIFKNGVSLKRVVNKINKLSPDVVFMPGDFVYLINKGDIESEMAPLSDIKAPLYAVTGNHDAGIFGENISDELLFFLRKYNVRLIDNAIERIEINGNHFTIIGLSDLWGGEIDLDLLNNVEESEYVIVLAHNPDTVYSFPKNAHIDLVISGHTHGGQVRLPFFYKSTIPSNYGFNKGLYTIGDTTIYVTSGIGMVGLPFRLLIPPEIAVLKIR